MTMYPGVSYGPGIGGLNNGGYWTALAQTSGSAINAAGAAYLGTIATSQTANSGSAVENTGFRTGEITAIRVWELRGGLLHSVYMGHVWHPGEVMRAAKVCPHWGEGIHAFKTLERTKREYGRFTYFVYGEVALWGEVIEFEHGWKAEYAKITKIYSDGFLLGRLGVWRLRKRYGV